MSAKADQLRRVGRQHLTTAKLLGIDFVPVSDASAAKPQAISKTSIQCPEPADAERAAICESKRKALLELKASHDATCGHCTSVTTHTQTVFGEGNPDARLMFIGEAPGEEEDRTGRPFVGRAGEKLDEIIRAMGLRREDVYIANVLKSRPPNNRTPLPNEVDLCAPFLLEQIRIIQPTVIVALGNPATKFLLQTDVGITRLRGQWGIYERDSLRIPLMPTFHPAYLLRNYTMETRKQMWSDMQAVMQKLGQNRG